MKIVAILLLMFIGILTTSGQENSIKNVGVIYALSDSLYHNHLGFTIFENFNKSYPQHDSINVIIKGLLTEEIHKVKGFKACTLDFSVDELRDMIENHDLSPVAAYDIIMVVKDAGTTTTRGYQSWRNKGRGINTEARNIAKIYANLDVELLNTSNGIIKAYDLHSQNFEFRSKALVRIRKKYFSPGENRKELSNEKLTDIQENLMEMYRMQAKVLFDNDQFYKTVSKLFKEKNNVAL